MTPHLEALAQRMHDYDCANPNHRGSHIADGLNRMRDLVDGPIAEVMADKDADITELCELLRVAVCPMAAQGCDGSGYPAGDPHGEYWQEQCQFCDVRNALLVAHDQAIAREAE